MDREQQSHSRAVSLPAQPGTLPAQPGTLPAQPGDVTVSRDGRMPQAGWAPASEFTASEFTEDFFSLELEAELVAELPRHDAQYAPPREAPRETDHRTLHMRRVVIAEQVDPRKQSTRMLRRGPAEVPGVLQVNDPASALGAKARSEWTAAVQRMPVVTMLGAVALGAVLGAAAWLYSMGATRALQISESRQLTRALLQGKEPAAGVEHSAVREPSPVQPAADITPEAQRSDLPSEAALSVVLPGVRTLPATPGVDSPPAAASPQSAATPDRAAALGVGAMQTPATAVGPKLVRPVEAGRSPARRKNTSPASSAPRGQTQRSWLENDEPAAWIR